MITTYKCDHCCEEIKTTAGMVTVSNVSQGQPCAGKGSRHLLAQQHYCSGECAVLALARRVQINHRVVASQIRLMGVES